MLGYDIMTMSLLQKLVLKKKKKNYRILLKNEEVAEIVNKERKQRRSDIEITQANSMGKSHFLSELTEKVLQQTVTRTPHGF